MFHCFRIRLPPFCVSGSQPCDHEAAALWGFSPIYRQCYSVSAAVEGWPARAESAVDRLEEMTRSGKIDRGSAVLQLVLPMRPAEEKKRLLAYPVGIGAGVVAEGKNCWRRLFTVAVKRRLSRVCRRLASGSSGGKNSSGGIKKSSRGGRISRGL